MRHRKLAIALAGLLASAMAAEAAEAPSRSDMRRACAGDYQRLCGDIELGGGRLRQCFADHAAELSPACADVLKRRETAKG